MRIVESSLIGLGLVILGCGVNAGEKGEETLEASLRGGELRYEQVDITAPPEGYEFWGPGGLSDHADVFGNGFDCDELSGSCAIDLVKLDRNLEFSVVAEDFLLSEVNGHGDVGGCVIIDDLNLFGQAAIVHANGELELIPKLPGELTSCVLQLSDAETAVVSSVDENFVETRYVLRNRRTFPFPLELSQVRDVNDQGVVAGIVSTAEGDRAYRFDSRTQTTDILGPVPPDPNTWGLGINRRGEVLGYSFVFSATERIGKWNRRNEFETFFVEGTPEFPTVSNELIWNEAGLVIVSFTTDGNTYVIPAPGVRLDLQDLVQDAVVPSTLVALDINERGDFVAFSLGAGSSQLYLRSNH